MANIESPAPKTAKELGISDTEWESMATDLLISKEIVSWMNPDTPLGEYHVKRYQMLRKYFMGE
jgi:hypothetical protein